MNLLLMAAVLLHPVLDEPTEMRLAASPDAGTVAWRVDGAEVGTTPPGGALRLRMAAGEHWVQAESGSETPWVAIARPDPQPGAGATLVGSWHATAQPVPRAAEATAPDGSLLVPGLLGAAALVVLAWPTLRRLPGLPAAQRLAQRVRGAWGGRARSVPQDARMDA